MNSVSGKRLLAALPLLPRFLAVVALWLLKSLVVLVLWSGRFLVLLTLWLLSQLVVMVRRLYRRLAAVVSRLDRCLAATRGLGRRLPAPPNLGRGLPVTIPSLSSRLSKLASAYGFSLLLVALAAGMALAPAALHLPVAHGAVASSTAKAKPAQPTPEAAGWWQRYTVADNGYSLALPPDWQVVPVNGQTDVRPGQEQDAAAASALAQRLQERAQPRLDAGAGLWAAVEPQQAGGSTAASINIIRQPLSSALSVDAFARANIASLQRADRAVRTTSQEWLSTSAGRVLRVQLTYTAPAGQSSKPLQVTQFFLVNGRNGYCITATVSADQATGYADVFEGIVRSLRWTA